MNLEQFRQHVTEQRKASLAEALSVLSATMSTNNERKEN
jgi:phenylpyruvate tautomerase PptA (4-oxalocrotonate tautomerase family)